ncbi:hypothetical protein [Plantactinospora sp. GCM10030261]|uniref:hypothetical protein n=1 Tax=Plantactinospora sp. GCM10030261 TaxID=3273420 RepID=UPI0036062897
MSDKPGSTAASRPRRRPTPAGDSPAPATDAFRRQPAPGAPLLALLALAWLVAMLWSTQRAISSNAGTTAIFSAAYALPGVISASLVGGAAAGLAAVRLLARRGAHRPWVRFAVAVGAGALTGLLSAVVLTLGRDDQGVVAVLAGTIAAATVIGGAIGALRPPVAGAVVLGGLAVFAATFVLSLFQREITSWYGAGDTMASQLSAFTWFSRTLSVTCGLAAGLAAYAYLRGAERRAVGRDAAGEPDRPAGWPTYLAAGAGPGLVLLLAETLIWTAGGRVLRLAGQLSEADQVAQGLLNGSRVVHGMGVLFLGGLVAMIAFGRTVRPADETGRAVPDDAAAGTGPAGAGRPDGDPARARPTNAGRPDGDPVDTGPEETGAPGTGPVDADQASPRDADDDRDEADDRDADDDDTGGWPERR